MNKKVLKLCGALGALALATVAGCGGDDIFGTTCPSGGYKLDAGTYNTTNAMITSDTCGFTVADLQTMRSIVHDTTGGQCKTTLNSSSNNELGTGAITSNAGQFTYAKTETTGGCTYDVDVVSTITVTADNTFTFAASYNESNFRQVQGMPACTMQNCTTVYTVTMKK